MKKLRTRYMLVDIVVLDVYLPHIWKRNFGVKLLVGRQKVLNMLAMLMVVPFHLLQLMSLGQVNGI